MKYATFNARSPFELGDQVRDTSGRVRTITDIVAIHSLKEMSTCFAYELDNNGELIGLMKEERNRVWEI